MSVNDYVRAAGVPVDLVVAGEPGRYPAQFDHVAHRVVLEGLTNAVNGASVKIWVEHGRGTVTVEVVDDGSSEQAPPVVPRQGEGMRTRRGGRRAERPRRALRGHLTKVPDRKAALL